MRKGILQICQKIKEINCVDNIQSKAFNRKQMKLSLFLALALLVLATAQDCSQCNTAQYCFNLTCYDCSSIDNSTAANCPKCSGYFLQENTCLTCEQATEEINCVNCTGYFWSTNSSNCSYCWQAVGEAECSLCANSDYAYIAETDSCVSCLTLYGDQCHQLCPFYYYDWVAYQCLPCLGGMDAQQCSKCSNFIYEEHQGCVKCIQAINDTQCICKNYLYNETFDQCFACQQADQKNCQDCIGYVFKGSCQLCEGSTDFDHCTNNCPSYFYDGSASICSLCSTANQDNCLSSICQNYEFQTDTQQCINCKTGINGSECLCAHYILNQTLKQCYSCEQADQTNCRNCLGYIFKDSCKLCDGSGDSDHCTSDCPGYFFDYDMGLCASCSTANQDSCIPDHCPNYEFQSLTQQCLNCETSFNKDKKCQCFAHYFDSQQDKCIRCSSASQLFCDHSCPGYAFFNNTCEICSQSNNQQLCTKCNGFYFNLNTSTCLDCAGAEYTQCNKCSGYIYQYYENSSLVEATNSSLNGTCTPCYSVADLFYCLKCPGYQFINSTLSCMVCDVANESVCGECVNYQYISSSCINCLMPQNRSECLCKGYFLKENGNETNCKACHEASQEECGSCSGFEFAGSCLECLNIIDVVTCSKCMSVADYYQSNQTKKCLKCSMAASLLECSNCPTYYFLDQSCVSCANARTNLTCLCMDHYYNTSTNLCNVCSQAKTASSCNQLCLNHQLINSICLSCNFLTSSADCNGCSNYFYKNNSCSSCLSANSQDQCDACLKGGYGFTVNRSCILCSSLKTPQECSKCIHFIFLNQSTTCHSCTVPIDGGCSCPGYYLDSNSNSCIRCTSAPDTSYCSLCLGYAFGNSSCFMCSQVNSSFLCSFCNSSIFLNGTCTPCNSIHTKLDCNYCSSQTYEWTSTGCSDCSLLNASHCSQCLHYGFYNRSCSSCFKATTSDQCGSCSGFQFINGSCVQCLGLKTNEQCLGCLSYFFNFTTTSCQRCLFSASLPLETCQRCLFYWSEGVCYISNQCQMVNCITCSSNTSCLQCLSGYNNTGGSCTSGPCSINNCLICLSSTNCYQCSPDFQLSTNGTSCLPKRCNISNCVSCVNSTCSKCLANYQLTSNGCSLICSVLNCRECSPTSICTSCSTNYEVAQSGAFCMPKCSISNCNFCATFTTCRTCNENYLLAKEASVCQLDCKISHCSNCQTASLCTVCEQYYELNAFGNVCSPALCQIDNCQVCDTASACLTCSTGYKLISKACTPICSINGCARCLSPSQCSYCSIGFKLAANLMACDPLCTISSCTICLSNTVCGVCAGGYTLTWNGTCIESCLVSNCQSCSSGKCVTCNEGFSVSQGGSVCYPTCGWNSISFNGSCISCLSIIQNCARCTASPLGTILCQTCASNYYLTGNNTCTPCVSAISNCFSCSSNTFCSQCMAGYSAIAFKGAICSLVTTVCQMENCQKCAPVTYCISCARGYMTTNGACTAASTCSGGQVFDGTRCSCPAFTFQSASACASCPVNCISCNSFACLICTPTYFVSAGICIDCPQNCLTCISSSLCMTCESSFSLNNGECIFVGLTQRGIIENNSSYISCPPNCKSCTLNQFSSVICIEAAIGSVIHLTGQVLACAVNCRECDPVNNNICTRCYHGLGLFNGECTPCLDANCIDCPSSQSICHSCKEGYAVQGSSCGACSSNCLICLSAGASSCDVGGCQVGYMQSIGGNACLKCANGCATCSSLSVLSCQSCMTGYFLNNGFYCLKCSTGCLSCSSALRCSACDSSYILINSSCILRIPFPCIRTAVNGCQACATQFQLDSTTNCILNNSCSASNDCSNCPDTTYLLNGTCIPCPSITNCSACDSKGIGCVLCNPGYYLNIGSCTSCVKGCSNCQSDKYCSQAANGYFLILYNGISSGLTAPCSSLCASCLYSSQNCVKCFSGFTLLGSSCVNNANIQIKLVLQPLMKAWDASASKDRKDQQLMQNWNDVQKMLLSITGRPDLSYIVITNYTYGSVIVSFNLSPGINQDPATVYNSLNNNPKPSGSNFEVVSSTSTAVGFSPPSSSGGANMGLILGVSIPLLLFVVIFMVALKHKFEENDHSITKEPKQVTIPAISNNGTERELQKDQMHTL